MNGKNYQSQYHAHNADSFPQTLRIAFGEEGGNGERGAELVYQKVQWTVDGQTRGLRYGENPQQEAALYKLTNGNLILGGVEYVGPDRGLVSEAELIRSGKHPGKINLTDVDSALEILKHLGDEPATVIVKHNNPSGVSQKADLADSYEAAFGADPVAAFGGVVVCNKELDRQTAESISGRYTEVVAAPEFAEGTVEILSRRKNIRLLRISNIDHLSEYGYLPYLDFHSLIDGGLVLQKSYETGIRRVEDFLPAEADYKGHTYRSKRTPTRQELEDLLFAWRVELGVTSNSVLYVRGKTTIGIGTGEQDRVGVAKHAAEKAEDRNPGSLKGSVMVSDGFFPFRDGVEVGLERGVGAIAQPGGSKRDWEVIEAVNEYNAAMVFTGERCFRH